MSQKLNPARYSVPSNHLTPYYDYFLKWYDFSVKYNSAIYVASLRAVESLYSLKEKSADTHRIQNITHASFDSSLRQSLEREDFAETLGMFLDAYGDLVRLTMHNIVHNMADDMLARWNTFVEPFRDSINRTPSEVISMDGEFDLLHYKSSEDKKHKTPLLVVGSLINRHYILDLLPKTSIVRQFQRQGFDVYSTDWMTPSSFDKDMTLQRYSEQYLENAVKKIQDLSGEKKISLFGYCWGGIFSIIYAAAYPENVKNLILHATPIDLEESPTVIEVWTKKMNVDKMVEVFGNIPGPFLNIAFLMRNPVEAYIKYFRFYSEPRTIDEMMAFFSVEGWLYDSRPIIGHVFREIVNDIYKKNLLIKNQMRIGGKAINLREITMPFLNIVGEKDDLVPPQSSKPVNDVIGSKDKKLIEFPSGHVGLCISSRAHEELWPKVVEWLSDRSQ